MTYEMESARMYFRRVQADDIDTLAPILRSEATMQALGGALSYEQTLDWIVEALHRRQQDGFGWFVALDKPTGQPAALCGLTLEVITEDAPALVVHCIVRHELRNIGVGRECVSVCLRDAFAHRNAPRVCAVIRPDNAAALHVAAACGMQPVGRLDRQVGGTSAPHLLCAAEQPAEA